MILMPPKHSFPRKFLKIYKELNGQKILGPYIQRHAFPDEPQFFRYACHKHPSNKRMKPVLGFGCSEDEGKAFVAAIGEAVEQYCILTDQRKRFILDSYEKLQGDAINPIRFTPFSTDQLAQPDFKKFRVTPKSRLYWVEGYSLTRKKTVLVPASVVFSDYVWNSRQPILLMKISNGVACGPDTDFAIYRGLCEVAERDSYMNCFINKIPMNKINFQNDPEMSRFIRRITRYDLEVYCLNTSLDTSVFTAACILLDRTGSGPAVCTGLGGSMSPQRAVQMAIYEAIRRHMLVRDWIFRSTPNPLPPISSAEWFLMKKQLIWSAPHMIRQAQTYLREEYIPFEQIVHERSKVLSHLPTDKDKIGYLVEEFKKIGCEAIYVDVTTPEINAVGLSVVRVLVPEMVPLSRDGRYPYLGVRRLRQFSEKYSHIKQSYKEIDMFTEHPF